MPEWLILADDLTGANDTGVTFARRGLRTLVTSLPGPLPPADVWVVSSASRGLPPAEAAGRVRVLLSDLLTGLPVNQLPRIYKKIDSALRGSPAEELGALLDVTGARRALVCSALPAQERGVMDGRVYWRGQPLAQTEFRDQIRTDDLVELFRPAERAAPLRLLGIDSVRRGVAVCVDEMRRFSKGIWIADALSSGNLDTLVQAAKNADIQVLCGAAGLAGAIAAGIPIRRPPAEFPQGGRPWLAVVGSSSPASSAQVAHAVSAGARLLAPTLEDVESANALLAQCSPGRGCILSLANLRGYSARVEAYLDGLVGGLVQIMQPGGLFLTGGDTAAAVCAALGSRLIQLEGEVEAGVPWGRLLDGPYAGLAVITKAGSFGRVDTLSRALAAGQSG
jgi:uncharacterized protein YgbK (DUF1537 family)